jgi:excisionase family DNA binding protein
VDFNTLFHQNQLNPSRHNERLAMARMATKSKQNREQLFFGRETSAAMLGVCTRTIDDAIRAKRLEAFKIGRRVLISRAALLRFATQVTARSDDNADGGSNSQQEPHH